MTSNSELVRSMGTIPACIFGLFFMQVSRLLNNYWSRNSVHSCAMDIAQGVSTRSLDSVSALSPFLVLDDNLLPVLSFVDNSTRVAHTSLPLF
jgi:hypothetical protein